MCAIAANALYTTLFQRGTTRQLAGAIVICVISALLLLLAIVWFELRFTTERAALSVAEIQVSLVYVALCGWVLPFGVTAAYCLLSLPRVSTASVQLPNQKRSTKENVATALRPPRHQPGTLAPVVFGEDTPWGWLEHRNGRFQGQRLKLVRSIITIGRGEENDIWLDDDMASRHHAELAWDNGQVYVTDCNSMNGVRVNGQLIRNSALIASNELLEIGTHRFIFVLSDQQAPSDASDPLAHHRWRTSLEPLTGRSKAFSDVLPATRPLADGGVAVFPTQPLSDGGIPPATDTPPPSLTMPEELMMREWRETAQIVQVTPPPQSVRAEGAMRIHDGGLSGQFFLLERSVVTVGRGIESDIMIDDESISRVHAQFLRQATGNYVQDLGSRNGTTVNRERLLGPRLLQFGDIVCIGNITLEYVSVEAARTAPLAMIITPRPFFRSMSGPMPLKLPSRRI